MATFDPSQYPIELVCFWCRSVKGRLGPHGIPAAEKVFDGYESCPSCAEKMKTMVHIIEIGCMRRAEAEWQIPIDGMFPTGASMLLSKPIFSHIFKGKIPDEQIQHGLETQQVLVGSMDYMQLRKLIKRLQHEATNDPVERGAEAGGQERPQEMAQSLRN